MARRMRKGLPINGWLIVDKDQGATSTWVVGAVKRATRAQKAGHGGTLDPLATGILPIALGEATKTVPYVMDSAKAYRFTLRMGEERDTDDAEGAVTGTSELRPSDAEIEAALGQFVGTVMQRPPSYAAVKIQGERAYDIARRGDVVELEPREVRIDELRLVLRPDADHAVLEMVCGKGAYVRAVARDLGRQLGCLAHVTQLRRTRVGPFGLDRAVRLEALEQLVADDCLPQALVPVATALAGIPALAVTEPQAVRLKAGRPIVVAPQLLQGELGEGAAIKVLSAGELVALARLDGAELTPLRIFHC
jgi:tRNA pseudouridine55 synthase